MNPKIRVDGDKPTTNTRSAQYQPLSKGKYGEALGYLPDRRAGLKTAYRNPMKA